MPHRSELKPERACSPMLQEVQGLHKKWPPLLGMQGDGHLASMYNTNHSGAGYAWLADQPVDLDYSPYQEPPSIRTAGTNLGDKHSY